MTASEFLKQWLQGSTCYHHKRSVSWQSDDGQFVLLKHHGHTEYVDRVTGSARCGTYHALYDLSEPLPDALGNPCLWRVDGRWNRGLQAHLETLCAQGRHPGLADKLRRFAEAGRP